MKSKILALSIFSTWFALMICGCAVHEATVPDPEVSNLLRDHKPDTTACFDQAKAKNNDLAGGSIRIRAHENRHGKLSNLRLMDGFSGSEPVVECLQKNILTWQLKPSKDESDIDFVFDFSKRTEVIQNDIKPGLNSHQLNQALSKHNSSFSACYEKTFRKAIDKPAGKLSFNLTVAPSGKLKKASLAKSEIEKGDQIYSCLKSEMLSWKFPAAKHETVALWSFSFE